MNYSDTLKAAINEFSSTNPSGSEDHTITNLEGSPEHSEKIRRLVNAVVELRKSLENLSGWHGEEELKILAEIDRILNQRACLRAEIYLCQNPDE